MEAQATANDKATASGYLNIWDYSRQLGHSRNWLYRLSLRQFAINSCDGREITLRTKYHRGVICTREEWVDEYFAAVDAEKEYQRACRR